MPPGNLCAKCRQIAPAVGDTWCTACSSWEFLGRELCASWDSTGARLLAGDICLTAARQIKALRSLSAGLVRRSDTGASAGDHRAEPVLRERSPVHQDRRSSLPRRRSQPARSVRAKDESEEEDDFEESDEESEDKKRAKSPDHRPLGGGNQKPPEPDCPPPHKRVSGETREASRERAREEPRKKRTHHHREGDRKRRGSHQRGGRKHQRLYRLAFDPTKPVHRKPGQDLWDLTCTRERPFDLGNLCK